jgi:hypothetical protein
MSVITSQQTARYYEQFSTVDVTFTREVIKATLLYPKQIFIKCVGYQWPCILFSSSMTGAKIITNVQNSFKQIVGRANNLVSLRYSFIQRDKPDPISFFVNARIMDYSPYTAENPDLNFLNVIFTNRPPDELIQRLGSLLEANTAAQNRREERINMTVDAVRDLNLNVKASSIVIDNIPRKCIMRDIAFSGIKVIIMGVAKFLVNKNATVRFQFNDPDETIDISGKVIRFEPIEGRQDIGAFVIQFPEAAIPVDYKLRLTGYFKQQRIKKVQIG